ncbi:AurF N-oxygenase family protein [Streptomyces malaysiensis]|uniref:Diiron oxygenase n=1 Tax=Streptomyces malaysiensis subsp. samsunensis TaxID=459658 RepID=A0A9X2RWI9_STRMQ|nr:diiron oxygenase [Streptomyces samsunensis]MCQ8830864.1 diiron oxygenase [Streptomyces samsunensis]
MTAAREEPKYERDLLVQLTRRWGKRVAVKKDELDLDGHFDAALPDFPEHLVPVLALPGADRLDRDARERILSAAWISYNAKTAAIEDEIILPACRLMLQERIPVRRDDVAVDALHQTIIDEHYHILMCHNAVGVTRRRRGLEDVRFAPGVWSVVRGLEAVRVGLSGFDRDIVDIAFSLAAETTISGFLSTLATAQEIQPMNRITTDLHRRDESGHAVVFRELCGSLYRNLDGAQREMFREALVTGLTAFRSADLDPWVTVAAQGGFEIDTDQLSEWAASRPAPARDTGPLQLLLDDLGISHDLVEMVRR